MFAQERTTIRDRWLTWSLALGLFCALPVVAQQPRTRILRRSNWSRPEWRLIPRAKLPIFLST